MLCCISMACGIDGEYLSIAVIAAAWRLRSFQVHQLSRIFQAYQELLCMRLRCWGLQPCTHDSAHQFNFQCMQWRIASDRERAGPALCQVTEARANSSKALLRLYLEVLCSAECVVLRQHLSRMRCQTRRPLLTCQLRSCSFCQSRSIAGRRTRTWGQASRPLGPRYPFEPAAGHGWHQIQ